MHNMLDVLAEHQSIKLENFEAMYISTNGTAFHMSQSFIAGSAILCLFMPNDRSLWDPSLIPSIPLQKPICRLKFALYARPEFIRVVFVIGIYLLRRHTPNGHIYL